jgi:hypothetical protein
MTTLAQIDAKLKECDNHNTQLAARKAMYAERIKKEFGADSVDDLKTMLTQVEAQLDDKNKEYAGALAEAETLLRKAGVAC